MKRRIGFILVALMVIGAMAFTSPALATQARVDALQTGKWVNDDTNVFTNPALLTSYPNRVIVEYGTGNTGSTNQIDNIPTNRYVGGTWQATDNYTVGAYINRYSGDVNTLNGFNFIDTETHWPAVGGSFEAVEFQCWDQADPNATAPAFLNSDIFAPLQNPLDLYGAYQLNDNTSIGVNLYVAQGSTEAVDATFADCPAAGGVWQGDSDSSSSFYGLNLGADIGNHEVSFQYSTTSLEAQDKDPNDPSKFEVEGDSFGLNYRGTIPVSSNVSVVPTAFFRSTSLELKATCASDPDHRTSLPEIDNQGMGIGCAARYETENTLFVTGLEIANGKNETDPVGKLKGTEQKTTRMTLSMGLEKKMGKRFYGRVGAQGFLYSKTETKDLDAETTTVTTGSVTNAQFLSIGVGYEYNNLAIDATIKDSLPFNGGYLLSGETGDLLGKISAIFNFL